MCVLGWSLIYVHCAHCIVLPMHCNDGGCHWYQIICTMVAKSHFLNWQKSLIPKLNKIDLNFLGIFVINVFNMWIMLWAHVFETWYIKKLYILRVFYFSRGPTFMSCDRVDAVHQGQWWFKSISAHFMFLPPILRALIKQIAICFRLWSA